MRIMNRYSAILAILLGCLLFAASGSQADNAVQEDRASADEVKQELREAASAIQRYAADQRQEALKKAEELLNDLDRRIEQTEQQLDEKWDEMSTTARERARETLKTMRQSRTELAEWYGGLKHSSDGAWEQMKKGFSDAYRDLGEAWQKARKEFEKEE